MAGLDRSHAREQVSDDLARMLDAWRRGKRLLAVRYELS
jgi:hypothetical protein